MNKSIISILHRSLISPVEILKQFDVSMLKEVKENFFHEIDLEEYLFICSMQGYFEFAKKLFLAGVDINCRGEKGSTPLMVAYSARKNDFAKMLIDLGADIELRDNFGFTAKNYKDYEDWFINLRKTLKK